MKFKKLKNSDQGTSIDCECKNLLPTTIVNDYDQIFQPEEIKDTFSSTGFNHLSKFQFWRFYIFYLYITQTGLFLILLIKAYKMDLNDNKKKQITPKNLVFSDNNEKTVQPSSPSSNSSR